MAEFIFGLPELRASLGKLGREFPQAAGAALYRQAVKVERLSRSLTPVLTGALRASHETAKPEVGKDVSVKISVGGPAAGYAVYVHENLDANHKVGQAKFLESALNASRDDVSAGVAEDLRKFVEAR